MYRRIRVRIPPRTVAAIQRRIMPVAVLLALLIVLPAAAHAQSGSHSDTGLASIQTLFTGTLRRSQA